MPPSDAIVTLLDAFRPEFTKPTWNKVLVLIGGTILARGRRTVAAALRQMGLADASDFSKYHQVFNRAVWSPLQRPRTVADPVGVVPRSSTVGRSRRRSRKHGRSGESRRNGSGPIGPSNGRLPACSDSIRWSPCAGKPCSRSNRSRSAPRRGIPRPKPPSPTCWRRSADTVGSGWIFGHPRPTRPVWKSPGLISIAS